MQADYKNMKVAVIGLARSGAAASILLKNLGADVYATDSSDSDNIRAIARQLREKKIEVEIGGHTLDFLRGKDLVVASPGVSDKSQSLIFAESLRIPIISEIELGWSVCSATVIAITGTNGKTTVTSLVAKVLEVGGRKALALGNIGKPFCAQVLSLRREDFVSLEVSSFQLERIVKFRPRVSVMLNLTADHLDRYKDMGEYIAAKKRIFMNQGSGDYSVLNYDESVVRDLASSVKAKVVFFGRQSADSDKLGSLNPNYLAAMAVARIFGIPDNKCLEVFNNFGGLEHRMEFVCNINGVDFINDSKATNVDSTIWALKNMRKPAVLIAGGRDKGFDYGAISNLIKEKVKFLVLLGEAKDKIAAALRGLVPIENVSSLDEAVAISLRKASSGECVILSPMCASYDMFDNYEHRGRVFKEAVKGLQRPDSAQ